MPIRYGDGLRDWINERLGEKVATDAQFIGRTDKSKPDEPVAVCAFSSYTGEDVELSFAMDRGKGTPGLLYFIFSYVFEQLHCSRCTAKIREDNADSINLVTKIGFAQEGRMRKAKSGKDILVYGLLKEDFYGKFTDEQK